jgi:hypothetical protein
MKQYPSIPKIPLEDMEGKRVIAFSKIDGSNIRAEWSRKKGFYKFGSRKRLIDNNDQQLGEAVSIISEYKEAFYNIFTAKKVDRAVCFFEYWGENSAFGYHYSEPHWATLIDVSIYKKGILSPDDFLEWFSDSDIPIPSVLYKGKIDEDFYSSVKNGTLEGIGSEGVVCKSGLDKGGPWMVKIKRQSWLDKLKSFCKDDSRKFEELA